MIPHTSYLRRERFRCGVLQAEAAHDKLSSNEVDCAGSLGSWSSLLFVLSGSDVDGLAIFETDGRHFMIATLRRDECLNPTKTGRGAFIEFPKHK